ncbi:hypothetical protein [Spiroplasma endosymbiont of Colias croceus]|uniref:hypothetical protein n=1 Tax=Spiroplasma endosymbiont of Colias croceus TaxID=3066310 RepID=UPI0030D1C35B
MKTWIKTNLNKITLALALTGAISGVTGLIIGSVAQNKTNNISYFLNPNYTVTWGAIIWSEKISGKQKIHLYFDTIKQNPDDIIWDGKYPEGYFNH